jgi:hypothetical protein
MISIQTICHKARLQALLQVEKLIANNMDPDQTAGMRRLVWIHAGRKPIKLILSWRMEMSWFQFKLSVTGLLEADNNQNHPKVVQKARNFYKSCMNQG